MKIIIEDSYRPISEVDSVVNTFIEEENLNELHEYFFTFGDPHIVYDDVIQEGVPTEAYGGNCFSYLQKLRQTFPFACLFGWKTVMLIDSKKDLFTIDDLSYLFNFLDDTDLVRNQKIEDNWYMIFIDKFPMASVSYESSKVEGREKIVIILPSFGSSWYNIPRSEDKSVEYLEFLRDRIKNKIIEFLEIKEEPIENE